MRGNRRTDTRMEALVRKLLHRKGLRFRKDFLIRTDGVKARPDIMFTRLRLAVFLDGCFWHGCPEHGTTPRVNQPYWSAKLARNRSRDELVTRSLEDAGWRVLRMWEHTPPEETAEIIAEVADRLRRRLQDRPQTPG